MSDTLKLAMRISAVDLFSGVLRRFRNEVAGTGAAAKSVQRDYDAMVRHASVGLKSLAVGSYLADKMKPALEASGDFQQKLLGIKSILQASNAEMDKISANALKVSNDLKLPAATVLDGQLQMIQAGVPVKATLESIDKHGKVHHGSTYMAELLAETRNIPTGLTSQNIAKIAHSFGVDDTHYGEMVDSIAKAMSLGSADPTELFYNLNQSGAVAHYQGHLDVQQAAVLAQALAPLGGESAAATKTLISAMTGAQVRGYRWQKKTGFDFFDKQGNYIGFDASLARIQDKIKGMTERQQDFVLGRDFGAAALPGLRLLMAVGKEGIKSYPEMERDYWKQPGLVAQNKTVSGGYEFQNEKFDAEMKNLYVALFKPMTDSLEHATHGVNDFAGSLVSFATDHPWIGKAASGVGGLSILGAAGYGGYQLLRSGFSLKSFLKGRAGLASGIVEGEAVKAATGIAPVFVTNWPSGFGAGVPGAAGAAEEAAEGAGTVGIVKRLTTRLGLAGTAFAELGGGGAIGAAIASGGVAIAGGTGYLAGHELSKHVIEGTRYGDAVGERIAHVLAFFGDKEAQQAIAQMNKAQPALQKLEGTIHIQISQDGRARVTSVQSSNPKVPLDVGTMLLLP